MTDSSQTSLKKETVTVDSKIKYLKVFNFILLLFFIFSVYLYLRRGYYDLYIINKVFANIAATQLGIVLLLGPLSRYFNIFDHFAALRKEIGITTAILIMPHVISSIFFLGDHFSWDRYLTTGLIPFVFGLIATTILLFLFMISNKRSMELLGAGPWRLIQKWGVRLGFFAVAIHVFVMKFSGWLSWYEKGGSDDLIHPEWPGLGLLVGWFIGFVIIIRISELLSPRLGKLCCYMLFLLPLIYILTFIWGNQFA